VNTEYLARVRVSVTFFVRVWDRLVLMVGSLYRQLVPLGVIYHRFSTMRYVGPYNLAMS